TTTIPQNLERFEIELCQIIEHLQDKRLLWIQLSIEKSDFIPLLTKNNFIFHHCGAKEIMMVKKLVENPIIPTAINHTLGVGAVIINDNKLLVVKDKIWQQYKLPGGYIDDQEHLSKALKREVFEETGIKIVLESVTHLGHFPIAQFEKANLYIICSAQALSTEINIIDTEEIIDAKWMDIETFLNDEEVHPYNKNIVKNAIENRGLKLQSDDVFDEKQRELFF
nr:NUDIX domain-containing protein [Campylobacterota bacterium]